MDLKELNKKFGMGSELTFIAGPGGWPYAEVKNRFASARISVYGAHVLNFKPNGEEDILWNTGKCIFQEGKPIRGGIPVCWPWFGPHFKDQDKPAHGFARLHIWDVLSTSVNSEGETILKLGFTDSPETKKLWPYSFSVSVIITAGKKLSVELSVTNTDKGPFSYTDALHSYFRVGDASQITIQGLQGTSFYDATDKNSLKIQEEYLLKINKEENRRHLGTSSDCVIHDPVLNRKIRISKRNSNTTVVWNPWAETIKTFADMAGEDYKTMVCVEAANAFNEIITIMPGQQYSLTTIHSLE